MVVSSSMVLVVTSVLACEVVVEGAVGVGPAAALAVRLRSLLVLILCCDGWPGRSRTSSSIMWSFESIAVSMNRLVSCVPEDVEDNRCEEPQVWWPVDAPVSSLTVRAFVPSAALELRARLRK
jgi:hypothetical protein